MQMSRLMWKAVLMVALGCCMLTGWRSSAEAVITIRSAEVVNGAAVVEGRKAAKGAPISWEGAQVTQANNGGNFAFQGEVPADCVGRLEDGVPEDAVDVPLANCTPVPPVEFPAPVPQTGQTQCWDSTGTLIPCAGTGQDGDIQAGVSVPGPRFTDQGNGTVQDNLTGLIWLQNANCFGQQDWANALNTANNLKDDPASTTTDCGLSDGSVLGDWRLPNVKELLSLVDFHGNLPALPPGHPFVNVLNTFYWSSTTVASVASTEVAWTINLGDSDTFSVSKLNLNLGPRVWPVRGGN